MLTTTPKQLSTMLSKARALVDSGLVQGVSLVVDATMTPEDSVKVIPGVNDWQMMTPAIQFGCLYGDRRIECDGITSKGSVSLQVTTTRETPKLYRLGSVEKGLSDLLGEGVSTSIKTKHHAWELNKDVPHYGDTMNENGLYYMTDLLRDRFIERYGDEYTLTLEEQAEQAA